MKRSAAVREEPKARLHGSRQDRSQNNPIFRDDFLQYFLESAVALPWYRKIYISWFQSRRYQGIDKVKANERQLVLHPAKMHSMILRLMSPSLNCLRVVLVDLLSPATSLHIGQTRRL